MMMKRKDVVALTGLCYSTIYNLEKKQAFPSRRQISPGRVVWMRAEVMEWLVAAPRLVGNATACAVS
jgi:prophage regulatory protein